MDVIKEKKKKTYDKKHIAIAVLVVFLLGWYFLKPEKSIDREELLVATVKQGMLNVEAEGYGKLRSNRQKLLTTQSSATVEEILLKPGAEVSKDSIIVRLKNPELEHEVKVAEQEYANQQALLRKLKVTLARELLSSEEQLEQIKADYETSKMRKEAMEILVSDGIVSQLDYNATRLKARQLKKRVGIIEKSEKKLKLVHEESINIQEEAIEKARSDYNIMQERFSKLTVKAGMDGVLQKLSVELGQSLNVGQQIALIGGTEDLIALVKVPQAEAIKVRVGQKAIIDTRKEIIESEVSRVSPTVNEGTVEVEISLTGKLPDQALRPEQSVDAVIHIERVANAYFIQRPVNARAFSNGTLYKLSEDQSSMKATPIRYGLASGQFIQITTGALAGDGLVISDLSHLDGVASVSVR